MLGWYYSDDSLDSWLFLCSLVIALSLGSSSIRGSEPTPARKLVNSPGVLVIAHRGNSSVAPENTLPAFAKALAAKADLVELDYHHSADGVPFVLHDDNLDRTTNAQELLGKKKVLVVDLSAAELARLDAGLWFNEDFKGTKIATLGPGMYPQVADKGIKDNSISSIRLASPTGASTR